MTRSLVVGAYSTTSIDFLVPILAAHLEEPREVAVYIAPPVGARSRWIARRPSYDALPVIGRLSNGSVGRSFHNLGQAAETLDDVREWVERQAGEIEQIDSLLANDVRANGEVLCARIPRGSESDRATPRVATILRALYSLMPSAAAQTRVNMLPPTVPVPATLDSARRLRHLLEIITRGDECSCVFRDRGRLWIGDATTNAIVKSAAQPSLGVFRLLTEDDVFSVTFTAGEVAASDRTERPRQLRFTPSGSLRSFYLAAEGQLGHVPWYVHGSWCTCDGESVTRALEVISPHAPKDVHRRTGSGLAPTRLAPSGSYLWDYLESWRSNLIEAWLGLPAISMNEEPILLNHIAGAAGGFEKSLSKRGHRQARHIAFDDSVPALANLTPGSLSLENGLRALWHLRERIRAVKRTHFGAPSSDESGSAVGDHWAEATSVLSVTLSQWLRMNQGAFSTLMTKLDNVRVGRALESDLIDLERSLSHLAVAAVSRLWTELEGVGTADLFLLFLVLGPVGLDQAAQNIIKQRPKATVNIALRLEPA